MIVFSIALPCVFCIFNLNFSWVEWMCLLLSMFAPCITPEASNENTYCNYFQSKIRFFLLETWCYLRARGNIHNAAQLSEQYFFPLALVVVMDPPDILCSSFTRWCWRWLTGAKVMGATREHRAKAERVIQQSPMLFLGLGEPSSFSFCFFVGWWNESVKQECLKWGSRRRRCPIPSFPTRHGTTWHLPGKEWSMLRVSYLCVLAFSSTGRSVHLSPPSLPDRGKEALGL